MRQDGRAARTSPADRTPTARRAHSERRQRRAPCRDTAGPSHHKCRQFPSTYPSAADCDCQHKPKAVTTALANMDAWLVARCAWALFVLNVMSTLTPTVVCNSTPPRFAAGRSTPEMWMSTPQLARVAGYEAEPHEVRTADGYLLTVHRILPRAASATATAHRTPVLAGHGLASCSEQWVVRPGNLSLMYRLVDSGFDVWLANYRGSYYGRKHVSLSVKSPRFWDFSWHENGVYDGPALIDHVLAVTGFESLITVGHSMSSTVQLVTLSARPEYAKKMRATILMAPPVYFGHPSGALQMVDQVFKTFRRAKATTMTAYSDLVRDNLFLPTEWPLYTYCYWAGTGERPLELCRIMFELTAGKLQKVIDPKLIRLLMAHYPAGASIRQILHYGQIMLQDGKFRRYNFGQKKNQKLYGTSMPPEYDLSKIAIPVYVYYGQSDNLVTPKDIETLGQNIRNLQRLYRVPSNTFNHVDFIIGSDGVPELISTIIDDMSKYI